MIGDNMVLQQQTEARLWGWAKPGKTIKITTSWSDEATTAKADKQGEWLAKVKTPKASYTPLSITFDDGEKLTISNVLAGEVWVCAGQSNMEMPVKGFWMCPVKDYNQVVIDAKNHGAIRSVKIPSVMSSKPLNDAQCEWRVCSPKTVGEFSATGYFFARTMHQALDIPIGLIEANKGGSRVESWLTKENLEKYTDDPTNSVAICKKWAQYDYHRSLLWGNGTFNPILNFTVKGILYYQGCSNVGDPGDQYSKRLKLLVEQWRSQFKLGEIPFYFVQMAYTALNRDYGFENVLYKSSTYKDMNIKDDAVYIHLDNNYHTDAPFEDIQGFEIAGEDRVFYPAQAVHFWQPGGGYWDEAIKLTSPNVKKPVAVRYCFRNFQIGNVKNGANLPLFPFRTDNW